jgi:hypothetical protein
MNDAQKRFLFKYAKSVGEISAELNVIIVISMVTMFILMLKFIVHKTCNFNLNISIF